MRPLRGYISIMLSHVWWDVSRRWRERSSSPLGDGELFIERNSDGSRSERSLEQVILWPCFGIWFAG